MNRWALYVGAALLLLVVGAFAGSCNRAQEVQESEQLVAATQIRLDIAEDSLTAARARLGAVDEQAAARIAAARERARSSEREARTAAQRSHALAGRLDSLLARSPREAALFDSVKVEHAQEVASLHIVIAAKDTVIAAKDRQLEAQAVLIGSQAATIDAWAAKDGANQRLIAALRRPEGVNLFGWRIAAKCGLGAAAGISALDQRPDVVVGAACSVG